MSGWYKEPKPPHGSAEWLAARWQNARGQKRITASVAAAVHREHKYVSMADLAVELLADQPPQPKEQNDAMRRGNILEGPIMRWASEILGVEITEPQYLYAREEPGVRLLATIDGMDPSGQVYEIKTYNKRWAGELPRYWYWQGVQQAICCDVPNIVWIVFDSNLELQFHTQTVTSDERELHLQKVREFLSFIDMGMIPDEADLGFNHVSELHPTGRVNASVELDAHVMDTLERLSVARQQKKAAEVIEDQLKAELGLLLGDAEFGTVDGTAVVSWKNSNRTSFDAKRFEAEHPALAEKYKKTSTFRTMRILAKEAQQ